jgi:hypothetical protein
MERKDNRNSKDRRGYESLYGRGKDVESAVSSQIERPLPIRNNFGSSWRVEAHRYFTLKKHNSSITPSFFFLFVGLPHGCRSFSGEFDLSAHLKFGTSLCIGFAIESLDILINSTFSTLFSERRSGEIETPAD